MGLVEWMDHDASAVSCKYIACVHARSEATLHQIIAVVFCGENRGGEKCPPPDAKISLNGICGWFFRQLTVYTYCTRYTKE